MRAETCEHFGAGFAPKGIMRGRLADPPIHDMAGDVARVLRTRGEEEPPVAHLPQRLPATAIFNAHRFERGDTICVARDPLQVLKAYENEKDVPSIHLSGAPSGVLLY